MSVEAMIGALLALYLTIGRWSPSRLSASSGGFIAEPRLWVVLALVIATEAGAIASARSDPQHRKGAPGWAPALLIAFLMYVSLSALWAPDSGLGGAKLYEVGLVLTAAVCVLVAVSRLDRERLRAAFWTVTVLLCGALALIALASGVSGERTAVLGGGPNVFGRLMGLLLLGSIAQLIRTKHDLRPRAAWAVPAAAGALLVVLSGSRGALIATAAAVPVGLLAARARVPTALPRIAAAVAVGLAVFVYSPLGATAKATFEARVIELTLYDRYDSGRGDRYAAAYALGLQHPVFGAGLAAFSAPYGSGSHEYPHNIFLEVFSECGGVGVLALALGLAFAVGALWRLRKQLDPASVAGFVLMVCASQFSGDLYDSRGIFVLAVLAVLPRQPESVPLPRVGAPGGAPWLDAPLLRAGSSFGAAASRLEPDPEWRAR